MNLKTITLAAILALSTAAHADDSEWLQFSETKTATFAVKKGSFEDTFIEIGKGKSTRAFSAMLRVAEKNPSKLRFYRPAVTLDDCRDGAGLLRYYRVDRSVMLDEDGKQFTIEFVLGGGSVGSNLADALCEAGLAVVSEERKPAPAKKPAARVTPV